MNRGIIVLDASAALALLFREPGSEVIERYLDDREATISAVNLSEVLAKQQEIGVPHERTLSYLQLIGVQADDFTSEMALLAASLRIVSKSLGLSFGDRACLALGKKLGCPVLTADRAWAELDIGAEVVVIR